MTGEHPERDKDLSQQVGHGRYTVRRRAADGSVGDVVGVLLSFDEDRLVLRDRYGDEHTIDRTEVIATRRVPDRPPPRRGRRDPD